MSEGAIPVANEMDGSAQVVIDHGRTGLPFHDDNVFSLQRVLKLLNADTQPRETIRQSAC